MAPNETVLAYRGLASFKSFETAKSYTGDPKDLVVRASGEGNVEFVIQGPRWRCDYDETLLDVRRLHPPQRKGVDSPKSGAVFTGRSTFWNDGTTHRCVVKHDAWTEYHVDPEGVPPFASRSDVPQLILTALEARTGSGDMPLRELNFLSEIPREDLSQVTDVSPVGQDRQKWRVRILVPERYLRCSPILSRETLPERARSDWAVIECAAELQEGIVATLEIQCTRHRRRAPLTNQMIPPSLVWCIRLSRDKSGSPVYRSPVVHGPTRVTDYRFRAKGDGYWPVHYNSIDENLLPEDSVEVSTQLSELQIRKEEEHQAR